MLALAFLGFSTANAQVGIGTTSPDDAAIVDVESTEKGFLPPRMTTAERPENPAEGLIIFNTTINCLEFFNGTGWQNLCDGNLVGPNIASGACEGEPEFFFFNSLEYRPVESSGNCWIDRNLGASQVATSSTDADSYGDMYQWGRATDGHEDRNSPNYGDVVNGVGVANFDNDPSNPWYGEFILRNSGDNNWVDPSVPGVDDLWQGVNGINNPCPAGYRVPTEAEWVAERDSWSSSNATGAIDSPLRLPLTGIRLISNGTIFGEGDNGQYWSSTLDGINVLRLSINSSIASMFIVSRSNGISVRCLKD